MRVTTVRGWKDCPTCRRSKPLSEWPRNASRPTGWHSECLLCKRWRNQERYWQAKLRGDARALKGGSS